MTGPRPAPAHAAAGGVDGIAYFGNDWFAENRTSSHHMARCLAGAAPLLYVDSPGMRAPNAGGRDLRRGLRKLAQSLRRPRRLAPGLWHCTIPQLPWRGLPGVAWLNERFGRWALRRALAAVGLRRPLLWFVVPHPARMMDHVAHAGVIYYCIDDYAAFPGVDAPRIAECDALLSRRSDHVFVASPALLAAKQALNPATSFSPHGVDAAHFARAQHPDTPVPDTVRHLRPPVVGYFGLLAAWTDLELLQHLARRRPDWTLLLVGHAAVDIQPLLREPNVQWVGARPYEELPSWAKAFDVAILPYRLNDQVRHANPLKLREYLASGKPVVSVPTPEVERFAAWVRIAGSPDEFVEQAEQAMRCDDEASRRARMAAVGDMSWERRAAQAWQTALQAVAARAGAAR